MLSAELKGGFFLILNWYFQDNVSIFYCNLIHWTVDAIRLTYQVMLVYQS